MSPKKVAIIGAGPSGLVTAKTLLHNFPHGTFSPIIFDSQNQVGGLWPSRPQSAKQVDGPPITLDPRMRTNLSRFTVAFSDLAWESVIPGVDIPIFPQARQVGQYLACYTERYIPREVLRLGCRVVQTLRKEADEPKWNVQWTQQSTRSDQPEHFSLDGELVSEDFDLIVIASGYFAQQYIPDVPGLEQFPGQVIHSSDFHYERENLIPGNKNKDVNGKVVVIGGSMSGVEAASAVALHLSTISTYNIPHTQEMTVHHIHSRPFWTLPTYLPHESSESGPSFLPLDLAMYNLGRRPPGPIEYSLGPIPQEKAVKTNNYFHSLLGDDYEKYAHMDSSGSRKSRTQPPWVAIGNDYAEFVRSGRIQTSMGRVTSIHSGQGTGVASLQYEGPQGSSETIDNVAAIVMATGFTPYKSLSLLPDEVLATLDYSETDPFSPLILDKGGTIRSEVSDVGFVGFYRGPYWGVMEMQARFLGKLWSGKDEDSVCTTENQMQGLRSLRLADPKLARGQFPMGDYVGLMEYFAKDLDISRSALDTGDSQSGPAVPARYLYNKAGEQKSLLTLKSEARKTLDSLHDALVPSHDAAQKAAASAIFRALHGTWKYCKQTPAATGCESFSGTLAFHPRYPTSQAHDREYLCVETHDLTGRQPAQGKVQSILRLAETCNDTATSRIEVWSSDLTDELSAGQLAQVWELMPLSREKEGDDTISGNHIISSKTADSVSGKEYLYTFHFEGVSISSWTCVELESGLLEDTTGAVGNGHKRESSVYSYVR